MHRTTFLFVLLGILQSALLALPSSCPSGQYITLYTLYCTTCPAGYYCVNGIKIICPKGTYQPSSGASSCIACVAGYYCGEGYTSQPAVPGNTFSLGKSSLYFSCSNGNGSISVKCWSNQLSVACDSTNEKGRFVNTGTNTCDACGSSYSCIYGVRSSCNSYYYTPTSTQNFCEYCPSGYSCNGNTATACSAGNYWVSNYYCSSCSSGSNTSDSLNYYCTGRTSQYFTKADGFIGEYYPSASSHTPAPATRYFNGGDFGTIQVPYTCCTCCNCYTCYRTDYYGYCSVNYDNNYSISDLGFTTCYIPSGVNGFTVSINVRTVSALVACGGGAVKSNYYTCSNIGAGNYAPDPLAYYGCRGGNFYCSAANSQVQSKCSHQYVCTTTGADTTPSAGGYYVNLQQTGYTQCIAGFQCPATNPHQWRCPFGTFSSTQWGSCSASPTTDYSANRINTDVGFGYYTSETNWWLKLTCPDGFQCSGKNNYIKCPIGSVRTEADTDSSKTDCKSVVYDYNYPYWQGSYIPDPTGADFTDVSPNCNVGFRCFSNARYPRLCQAGAYCPYSANGCPYTHGGSSGCAIGCGTNTAAYTGYSGCLSTTINHDKRGLMYAYSTLQFTCNPGYYWNGLGSDYTCSNRNICNKHERDYDCYNLYNNGATNWGATKYYCLDQADMTITTGNTACNGKRYSQYGYSICFDCLKGYDCSFKRNLFIYHGDSEVLCSHEQYSRSGDLLCHKFKKTPVICAPTHYQVDLSTYTSELTEERDRICKPYLNDLTTLSTAFGLGTQTECLAGTYKAYAVDICTHSHHGYIHSRNTAKDNEYVTSVTNDVCPFGSYCYEYVDTSTKSHVTISRHCPIGTYQSNNVQDAFDSCVICPEGYYCPGNGQKVSCPANFYCKQGHISGKELYCPPGYLMYTGTNKMTFYDLCTQCQTGQTCSGSSTSSCPLGYICPLQTNDNNYYGSISGQYQPTAGSTTRSAFADCPSGYYCLPSSTIYTACPSGTYQVNLRSTLGASGIQNCLICTYGYYCTSAGMYYAPSSSCLAGRYCPDGSITGINCPAGTYRDTTGGNKLTSCIRCPAGYYCPEGMNAFPTSTYYCIAGYYCPLGTRHAYEFPCPAGYNLQATAKSSLAECNIAGNACPQGYYCPIGTGNGGIACPAGHICPTGSALPTPTSVGMKKSSPTTQITCAGGEVCRAEDHAINPVICSIGFYSTTGYSNCELCTEGRICTTSGATIAKTSCSDGYWAITGSSTCLQCPPGYYCASGVKTQCGAGKYCAIQSSAESVCGAGKYCASGLQTVQRKCPPGTYASSSTSGSCTTMTAGYYSAQGAAAIGSTCAPGFYCEAGSRGSIHKACPEGYSSVTYARTSLADCLDLTKGVQKCPLGKFCPSGTDTASLTSLICPQGYYCIEGTYLPVKCPLGTYGAATGLQKIDDCTNCVIGKACTQTGLSAPDFDCLPGYNCKGKSYTQSPRTDSQGGTECQPGGYCLGNVAPQSCSDGYYNPFYGSRSNADCIQCPKGFYCSTASKIAPTDFCTSGHYCPSSTSESTIQNTVAGYAAPDRQGDKIKCIRGNVTTVGLQKYCALCSAGKYCPNDISTTETACTTGHFCLAGTISPKVCRVGAFNTGNIATQETDCAKCSAGSYCPYDGMSAVNNDVNDVANAETHTCAAGYYCVEGTYTSTPNYVSNVDRAKFGPCPKGYYCVAGTSVPVACPIGTYSNSIGNTNVNDCVPCDPGYYCGTTGLSLPTGLCDQGYVCDVDTTTSNPRKGSGTSNPLSGKCPVGYYCPQGTPYKLICPVGTYQDLEAQWVCKACVAGYYCPEGSSAYTNKPCDSGHYCPTGTTYSSQSPCNPGTFNPSTGKDSSSFCGSCTQGKFCLTFGLAAVTGDCSAGFYCLAGARYSNPPKGNPNGGMCTFGEYCPVGASAKTTCESGKYCSYERDFQQTGNCDDGYLCNGGNFIPNPHSTEMLGRYCAAGKYCTANVETNCGTGYYMPYQGAKVVGDCIQCPLGYACTTTGKTSIVVADQCNPGSYCNGGSNSLTQNTCSQGYYCPKNSFEMIICNEGTYSNAGGLAACLPCTASNYCPYYYGSTFSTSQITCTAGYSCSLSNLFAPVPCDVGKYQSSTGQTSCNVCPNNKFCDRKGLSAVSGTCADGYLCLTSNVEPMPYDLICPIGYYCPNAATRVRIACDQGSYCSNYAQIAISGTCYAGYICKAMSTVPNPTDGVIGYVCPVGKYCTAGMLNANIGICGAGTYNDFVGSESSTDCRNCINGMHCLSAGLSYPTSTYCAAGKYCINDAEYNCPIGYKCPLGFLNQILCLPGTYTGAVGQSACSKCPIGNYCRYDYSDANKIVKPVACPQGFYCPEGTSNYESFPCPAGTISTATGYGSLTDCVKCPVTKYCLRKAQSVEEGICEDGYLCPLGSSVPSSKGTTTECPINYYCTAGVKSECSAGTSTYTGTLANRSPLDCVTCPPGKLCQNHATTITNCNAGKYCINNVETGCLPGSYCPAQSFVPRQCKKGTYSSSASMAACSNCDVGYFCDQEGMSSSSNCPANRICLGSTIIPSFCTYSTYLSSINTCSSCPVGKWCWIDLTNNIKGDCKFGHICHSGSNSPTPPASILPADASWSTYNGRASPGYYTSTGDNSLHPCSPGTYQTTAGVNQCITCPPGFYCAGNAITNYTNNKCSNGYVCKYGSTVPNPNDGVYGYICPAGKYCPSGNTFAQTCSDGQISLSVGKFACDPCPDGNYCVNGTKYSCKGGNTMCVSGTKFREPLCPLTTYNDGTSCSKCPAGMYCVDGKVIGGNCYRGTAIERCKPLCMAGYICIVGSAIPNPTSDTIGKLCDAGKYCLHGTSSMAPCPIGKVRQTLGAIQLTDCVNCKQGQICYEGNPVPEPCPAGYFCPPGEINKCPKRTYNPGQSKEIMDDCLSCTSGHLCIAEAITDQEQYKCPKGMYCYTRERVGVQCPFGTYNAFPGSTSMADCIECMYGYYCEEGCTEPAVCPDGFVCEAGAKSGKMPCPGGFYCQKGKSYTCPVNYVCPRGSKDKKLCTEAQYCPAYSEFAITCLDGQFAVLDSNLGYTQCVGCPAGSYRETTDSLLSCKPCEKGYLCLGGTNTKFPRIKERDGGVKCPAGYYCPEGSSNAVGCPAGTYNPYEGITAKEGCTLCPTNTYSANAGQSACDICGNSAFSLIGAAICQCYGLNRKFLPTDSSCRCLPGFEYLESGIIFSDENSRKDCSPVVYPICSQDQVRTFNGKCIGRYDCNSSCGTAGGVRSAELGVCACNGTKKIDNICDWKCRRSLPTTKLAVNDYGTLSLLVTVDGETTNVTSSSLQTGSGSQVISGAASCAVGSKCNVIPLELSNTGVTKGLYGVSSSLKKANTRLRRSLVTTPDLSITNPVICTYINTTVTFDIPDTTHYPVYQKDSLLNSNPNFDYGAFKMLESTLKAQKQNGITSGTVFAYTFKEGGNYFFTDSVNTEQTMIVSVKRDNEKCASSGVAIEERSTMSLSTCGVSVSTTITLAPDYSTLLVLGGILLMSVVLFFVMFYILEYFAWNKVKASTINYRNQQKELSFESLKFILGNGEEDNKAYINVAEADEFIDDELSMKDLEKLEKIDLSIMESIQQEFQKFKDYFNNKLLFRIKQHGRSIKKMPETLKNLIFLIEERYAPLIKHLNIDINFTKLPNAKLRIDDPAKVVQRPKQRIVSLCEDELNQLTKAKKEAEKNVNQLEKDILLSTEHTDPEDAKKEKIKTQRNDILTKIAQVDLNNFEKDKLQDSYESAIQNVENILMEEKLRNDAIMQLRIEKRRKQREEFLNVLSSEQQKEYMDELTKANSEIEKSKKEAKDLSNENKEAQINELKERVSKDAQLSQNQEYLSKELMKIEENASIDLKLKLKLLEETLVRQKDERLLKKLGKESIELIARAEKQSREEEIRLTENAKKVDTTNLQHRFAAEEEQLISKQKAQLIRMNGIHNESRNEMHEEAKQSAELEVNKGVDKAVEDIKRRAQEEVNIITEKKMKLKDRQLLISSNGNNEEKNQLNKGIEMYEEKIRNARNKEQDELSNLAKEKETKKNVLMIKKTMNMERKIFDELMQFYQTAAQERLQLHTKLRTEGAEEQIKEVKKSMTEEDSRKIFDTVYNEISDQCESELFGQYQVALESSLRAITNRFADTRIIELQLIKNHYKLAYTTLEQQKKDIAEEKFQNKIKKVKIEEENDIREAEIKVAVMQEKEISSFRQNHEEMIAKGLKQTKEQLMNWREGVLRQQFSIVSSKMNEKLEMIRQEIEGEKLDRVRSIELEKKIFIDIQEYELKQRYNGYDEMIEKQAEIQKKLEQKKASIHSLIEQRKRKLEDILKTKDQMTKDTKDILISKYTKELEDLESSIESERNRQFLLMKERLDKKKLEQEKKRAENQKMVSYFVGAIDKNMDVQEDTTQSNDPISTTLSKWKQEICEQEKEEKVTTFEGLGRFLEHQKVALMDVGGIYLEGDRFAKYRMLVERLSKTEAILEQLKSVKLMAALMDANKVLKWFGSVDLGRKTTSKRIGGGYVCFDETGNVLKEMMKYVATKLKKKKEV